ncbi:unnamed protein product [Brassica oleracea]
MECKLWSEVGDVLKDEALERMGKEIFKERERSFWVK